MSNQNITPVFENGAAQPVFPFTDGKTGAEYDAKTSEIVRYCVYVESDYDMDGDGQRDLVKAFVQVPRSAAEGNYKAATIFEARPYCAGVNSDGYDHMKEVEAKEYPACDFSKLGDSPAPRVPAGEMCTLDAAAQADPSEWYFLDKGSNGMVYENIDMYDYYLVRGFAVVVSAGFGAYGSEGFEYVGSSYERDAFKFVVEWLHGDRVAYTDRTGRTQIKADWSNGNVGMTGRSYAGTMPFAVACTGTPGLKTIVPVAGISDWYSFLNQQGAQRYWPKEMLMSFLSYYCTSRYSDPELTDEMKAKLDAFHHQLSMEQIKTGFDYGDFWEMGNYTLQADHIGCSAYIVHGLNDENVSTKQFEMMLQSFQKAGKEVKVLLHQGPHMTPTMANKGYGISIDGKHYDDIMNKWFSHYLYGVENDAEDMPAVLVQDNYDQSKWHTADAWETGKTAEFTTAASEEFCEKCKTVLDTDWAAAGIDATNFDEKMSTLSSGMNQRYLTDEIQEEFTIQGSVRVEFTAALAEGKAENGFDPENANDADILSMALGDKAQSGRMDDVKMTVMLCDVADEAFDSIQTTDEERNVVPVVVEKEGAVKMGSSLSDFNEVSFEVAHKNYKVIARAYMDLCNPAAGYAPETSAESIELVAGEDHDYHVFLNTARYTVAPGHKLAVVLGTEDPINCLIHKQYKVAVKDLSVKAVLPVCEDVKGGALRK